MKFTKKIGRIGGQSKCPALEPFNLKEWKKRVDVSRTTRKFLFDTRDDLRNSQKYF